ncbi:Gp20 [Mycolicibacterium canariasense]|uniref:Gp20 n=1 Tax=Mycolicibacterium canariasense TaxID=228230 RepID=A0A100WAC8_MYCCR|nr:phage tail tape measure protein [Mycolicibacterium canariasense]MCV7208779.1 phage tail tape measure protein [Mycolicibacterium canariasense]ORV07152.1 hypothetical protein AWB94_14225 [Mycolicibacterium canariasense]GAS94434.1 Gp20 [Mycolicibacterium canariasense]
MASGAEVGRYVLPIMPSIEGIGPNIDRTLGRAFAGVSKSASRAIADGVADGVKAAEAAVEKSTGKIAKLREKEAAAVDKLRVAEERINETREKGGSALARAEAQRNSALRAQKSAISDIESETRALTRAQKALNDAQDAKNIRSPFGRDTDFLSGLGSQMDGVTGRFEMFGKGAGGAFVVGAVAAIGAGALLEAGEKAAGLVLKGFESIIDEGLDFSKTMNNFQGVTRAAPEEMAKMQHAARALGADTTLAGASASGAAEAMTELAKAGFTVDQAIGAARGTLELATAGQIESAQAAEIQANAMNAFGLSADSAAHTADVLANAAIASSADIPDLAQALQQVGGVAQGFGENLDDTVAALAMFANAGIKGSDAGTLLKTTMQSITDQGAPAQEAIHTLGLELYKLNDQGQNQFVGFRELFRQLDEAKKRINDPEIFQAQTNILFGSDAMRSAMLGNAQAFDDMIGKLQRVGAAGEMANAQMQGLPGAVESFKNTTESIKLDAFEALGPALTGGLNAFVDWLTKHKGEVVQFFVTMGDAALRMGQIVAGAVGDAAGVLGTLAGAVGLDDMSQSLKFVAQSSDEAVNAMGRARLGLELYGKRTAEAKKFTDGLGDAVKNLKADGENVLLDVKDNTPEVRARLDAMHLQLGAIADDPTHLRILPMTKEATDQLEAWRYEQSGESISPTVHPELGQANAEMKQFLDTWSNAVIKPEVRVPGQSSPTGPILAPGIPIAPRAQGGIDSIGSTAHIGSPEYPNGLVRYREPSTGGEAYIPLKGGQRSVDIWEETGRRLGVWAMDAGGFLPPSVGSEHGLQTDTIWLARAISSAFPQISNIGGWRPPDGFNEHSSGSAVDVMVPNAGTPDGRALGDQIARFALSSGLADYVLWQQTQWNADGSSKPMADRGSPTQNHMDHVHVHSKGGGAPAAGQQYVMPAGLTGTPGGGYNLGGTAGIDPETGESGTYTQDPKQVREATQRVTRADQRVAELEQRKRELKADAKESERLALENDIANAKEDAQDARDDLAAAQKGKFKANKAGKGVNGKGNELDPVGGIFGSFLKETFGLDGSVFPDISQLGIVQLANALMGIKYTPQGHGFPWQTGYANGDGTPWSGSPFAAAGSPGEGGGGTSGLPFGMIPSPGQIAGFGQPGMAPPGTPASGVGLGPAPGPLDMSRNVSIQVDSGPSSSEIGNVVRREVANVDRLNTYLPKGV